MTDSSDTSPIDRLLDAVELVTQDRREEARHILRELIQQNNDFEDAWLWMALAVDSADKSEVCLDNVLRINPENTQASGALYRLRHNEIQMVHRHTRLRTQRDIALGLMWLLTIILLYAMLITAPVLVQRPSKARTVQTPPPAPTSLAPTPTMPGMPLLVHPIPQRRGLLEADTGD